MRANYDLILFDLDGTISDPLLGVSRSINHALTHYNYEPIDLQDAAKYIGPPLDQTFQEITGLEDVTDLVAKYRDRYAEIGYSENLLYPGIAEVLQQLSSQVPLAICTSKRSDFADRILQMFQIRQYFQFISGGEIGVHKYQQIADLLSQGLVSKDTLMVGDRAVDLIAAHKNGLKAAGVLWGYGSLAELEQESPLCLLDTVLDLLMPMYLTEDL
jgi:phosphoglycolate phosphatase